jgi:UDP-N-acetylmuramoyl-tripeptide--D-alanyl-D-alanine ligase
MFKLNEIIAATAATLISGKSDISVENISINSRTIRKGDLFIAIKGSRFDGHDFVQPAIKKGAIAIIVEKKPNRRIAVPLIKVHDTKKALAQIAQFQRKKFNLPVVGITGSNGKTTAKDMLAWILEKKFRVLKNPGTQNNQIGLPMTLLKLNKNFDLVVLEMGTSHFGEIAYLAKVALPTIAIITNIGPAHLEFLKNLAGVYREKISLLPHLIAPSVAVLNMDDNFLRRQQNDKNRFVLGFAIKNHADFRATRIKREKSGIEFLVNSRVKIKLRTTALNNVYNALAAISVARLLGLDYNIISQRLSHFTFPRGRFSFFHTDKINFIDDTYNSNPASLKSALDTLSGLEVLGRKILVMGDMLELGKEKKEFHRLAGKEIAKAFDILITVGELSRLTAQEALKSGLNQQSIFNCDSAQEAKRLLLRRLNPTKDDLILVKGSRLMQMEKVIY